MNPDEDLASKAAGLVTDLAEALQDRAIKPLFFITRVVVYGLIALALAVAAGVLAVDVAVKLLDAYVFAGRVWITYLVIGAVVLVVSVVAWRRMGRYRLQARELEVGA
jgi:uncharacterized membrane protein YdbT with pleckstrin-like domain